MQALLEQIVTHQELVVQTIERLAKRIVVLEARIKVLEDERVS